MALAAAALLLTGCSARPVAPNSDIASLTFHQYQAIENFDDSEYTQDDPTEVARFVSLPDDFLGLKMRIQSSKVLEAQMNALGAVPQVMAFSEVYQALQTGVVDGTENPPSNMYTQKMNEVQTDATISNHGYLGYAVIVNKQFWDGLPDDVRAGLEKAMAEATDYANSIAKDENDKALEAMKAAGTTEFHELTDEERAAWLAVLEPVHEEMADRIGAETIAAVKAAVGQ